MAWRKNISKRTRFEVLMRDGFTCQYCGAKAPDVCLHVDHITPVIEGGGNELSNLITACTDCNYGKSGFLLTDSAFDFVTRKRHTCRMCVQCAEPMHDLGVYCDAYGFQFCDAAEECEGYTPKHGGDSQ